MEAIVKESFLAAAADVEFQDMWMTAETWAELICLRYNLLNDNSFTGRDLNKVLGLKSNAYLTNQMDVDRRNVPSDHIGIFRDRYKDSKTNKKLTCFYACKKGEAPKQQNTSSKWYSEISDGKILVNKFKTRGAKRNLSVNGVVVSSNLHKRKHDEKKKRLMKPSFLPLPAYPLLVSPLLLCSHRPLNCIGNPPKLVPYFIQKMTKQWMRQ